MTVLILAPEQDLHAQAVKRHLVDLGEACTQLGLRDFLRQWHLHFSISPSVSSCQLGEMERNGDARKIDLKGFKSIWLRRADQVKASHLPEPWMESMVEWETNRALEGIFTFLPALWVNKPQAEKQALLKIHQLESARECKLNIPETIVTNDPNMVSAFYKEHNGNVIYKFIDEGTCHFMPRFEVPQAIGTMPFREQDLTHLDQVHHSLHLFQRKINKKSDIRVTIVGEKIFAAEIKSQEGRGKIDFRLDYSVPMEKHDLPADVAANCLILLKKLDVSFGALDLCLDHSGKYFFLEINPAGQWLWLEDRIGLPISLALANLLAGR